MAILPVPESGAELRRTHDLHDPRLFLNRELSWLEFNQRVLDEAADPALPVLERLKFLGIVSSNLDEFFMVRVAGLKQQIARGVDEKKPRPADGLSADEQLEAVQARAHRMVEDQYAVWRDAIRPALARDYGIAILPPRDLSDALRARARDWFRHRVLPVLTPLSIDRSHPFPQLRNKSITIAVQLPRATVRRRRAAGAMAVVGVPAALSRLVPLDARTFVLLEDLVAEHVGELFSGDHHRVKTAAFRVTRNWDLEVDEEEAEDLLEVIQEGVRTRDRGLPVRLEIAGGGALAADGSDLETLLCAELGLARADVYRVDGPLELQDLQALQDAIDRKRRSPAPRTDSDESAMFQAIRNRPILFHHPYDSFDDVVRFIEEAADDPQVRAIRQVLYRTGSDSPFVKALLRAAENGKEVVAFLEIQARLDEKNNIGLIEPLKNAGAIVIYGYEGGGARSLKTHCKVSLVTRREGDELRHYVHVGTGNYNPTTARIYTDVSILSADRELGEDVHALFNMLTANTSVPPSPWRKIHVAPRTLRERLLTLIREQAEEARAGRPARIAAKMNSLVHAEVIRELYRASQAGVEIDLLVRGICCLRPGVPDVSDRIRVHQVVDRYLEHSRIFVFGAPGGEKVFISSADWMPRNLESRVEVMVPVEDPRLKEQLVAIVDTGLADTAKGARLLADGRYERLRPADGAAPLRSQDALDPAKRAANDEQRTTTRS